MAEILLRGGKKIHVLEDTADINAQKGKESEFFNIHVIDKVESRQIKRTDILTMRDD